MTLVFPDRPALGLDRPRMMGILNVTPDSFSDGGAFVQRDRAQAHARQMLEAGAAIIDIGGESTRPGARRIEATEQIARVQPMVQAVRATIDQLGSPARISIDTTQSAVAAAALDAGASMINDISAGREDPRLLAFAAARDVPIVLMHMQGEPGTMQQRPHYDNVVAEVKAFLLARAAVAQQAGVRREKIVLDPGIGFGKTVEHNLALLAHLDDLLAAGYSLLLGASRKRFIASVSGQDGVATDRLGGTCATTAIGVAAGVRLFRVHDVAANQQAAAVAWAVRAARPPA